MPTTARRSFWRPIEIEAVAAVYPHVSTRRIAEAFGRPVAAIYRVANLRGIRKSEAYLASADACRLRRGDNIGAAYRFKPGIVPHNKGLRRPGYAPGRMADTQFKPGVRQGAAARNWVPIGSTRLTKVGYLQRKMTDTGYPPRDWVCVHHLVWIAAHGPIPEGHRVVFKDGDKTHIAVGNLELVTIAEMMRRNTIHRLPAELKQVIFLNGVVKRKVREHGEKHDSGSARPSVRDDRAAQRRRQSDGREAGESDQRRGADADQRRQARA